MDNFTIKEIDMLIDGLSALKNKGDAGHIMGMTLAAMMPGTKEEKEKRLEEQNREHEKKEAQKKALCEDADILKGKLIQFRREMEDNMTRSEISKITQEE